MVEKVRIESEQNEITEKCKKIRLYGRIIKRIHVPRASSNVSIFLIECDDVMYEIVQVNGMYITCRET